MTTLINKIKRCTKCEMSATRTHVVIGQGPLPCKIVFLGEAPGRKEDETGIPFSGPSGDLLEATAFKAGLKRGVDYHILNLLKCRPPENRDPTAEELLNCRDFLKQQLKKVQPRVIVAFGRYAQAFVMGMASKDVKVLQNVGKVVPFTDGCRGVLSYHPAYVLRNRNTDMLKGLESHMKLAKKLSKEVT